MHRKLFYIMCFVLIGQQVSGCESTGPVAHPLMTHYIVLSQNLLYAVRTGDSTRADIDTLARASTQELARQLADDAAKKAFWLNVYNAFVQIFLQHDTTLYQHRPAFFSRKSIVIAGHHLSLDDIEHGMLRHSKIKWSLGYLNKPFPSAFEKQFRVDTLDDRIHFALNCGARSCPPIAFYDPAHIDQQLDLATKNYLFNELSYDTTSQTLYLPAIMGWFRHDFGGKKGMLKLVKKWGFVPEDAHPHIRFKPYDWTLYLHHFQNDTP